MASPPARWGWHRLDREWAERLVADAALPPRAIVIDGGAGDGAITGALVRGGMRVIAVELHAGRAQRLREHFAGCGVVVVQADLAALRLPRRPYYAVANPPFATTTALLRRLVQPGSRLVRAHVVLQEQAAARWANGTAPGASRWSRTFSARLGTRVPRAAFAPRPPVSCRVLVIERRA